MPRQSPFTGDALEAIAKVLADTHDGLSGSEIGHVLAQCRVEDTDPTMTKWKRLYNALANAQNRQGHGAMVVGFIHKAMKPARWRGKSAEFDDMRANLNEALAFTGLALGEDGELHKVQAARTVAEAEERADLLRGKLKARGVHDDVLRFCRAELLQRNYFHAVLEATKSVADKIRTMSGLSCDGAELVQAAFGQGQAGPVLAINTLATDTERSEQRGFVNLLVGLFGTFRNPTAHEARIYWPIDEQDALDILSLVSLVHRKLDGARQVV
ncbi:MAG: TIGR02391 family protein [Planctomycetota bacterium]